MPRVPPGRDAAQEAGEMAGEGAAAAGTADGPSASPAAAGTLSPRRPQDDTPGTDVPPGS